MNILRPQRSLLYYTVDQNNILTGVGGYWDDFANDNNGNSLTDDSVVGTPLIGYIVGDETRSFVTLLLARARARGSLHYLLYRCDAPDEIRLMSMTLIASEGDMVLIAHRVIERTPAAGCLRFHAQAAFRGIGQIERCSLCNSIRCKGRWQEAHEAAEKGFVSLVHSNAVYYSVCDVCRIGALGLLASKQASTPTRRRFG